MKYDVVVVGGGFAGLSLASILSKQGHKLSLFERSKTLGGRGRYIEKDGFLVDYGIHLFRCGASGEGAKVFGKIGRMAEFVKVGKPEIFVDGKFKPFPSGALSFLTTRLVPFKAKPSLLRVLIGGLRADLDELYRIPVKDFLSQKIKKDKRRKEVENLISTLGGIGIICSDMEEASTGELWGFLKRVSKAKETVGYVKYGMKHVIDSLEESIRENGGKLETSTPIKRIIVEEGKVKGVEKMDSTRILAEKVVYASPAQELSEIISREDIIEKGTAEYIEKISSIKPTRGVGIELALKEKITDKNGVILAQNPLIMGCFTSNVTDTVAPEGKQLASFFYPTEDIEKPGKKDIELLKNAIRRMFPGIQGKTEWELERVFPVVDGAMPTYQQSYLDRPDFKVPGIENLYLIGDTTRGMGTGGDIAFSSALKCADMLVESF